jgi:sterol desaturase/sphingolipid hydroxylase (fatty acid hydroxylase superfamily)
MQLSKVDYYSDYVVYPIVIGALAFAGLYGHSPRDFLSWVLAFLGGLAFWTLFEYVVHRVLLHQFSRFVAAHAMHHAAPKAYIGTPTYVSIPTLVAGIGLPIWFGFGFSIASGALAGVMTGYTWYGLLHHMIHHWKKPPSLRYMRELQTYHMRHHYSPKEGNFGVTTAFWDRLFGTAIGSRALSNG